MSVCITFTFSQQCLLLLLLLPLLPRLLVWLLLLPTLLQQKKNVFFCVFYWKKLWQFALWDILHVMFSDTMFLYVMSSTDWESLHRGAEMSERRERSSREELNEEEQEQRSGRRKRRSREEWEEEALCATWSSLDYNWLLEEKTRRKEQGEPVVWRSRRSLRNHSERNLFRPNDFNQLQRIKEPDGLDDVDLNKSIIQVLQNLFQITI